MPNPFLPNFQQQSSLHVVRMWRREPDLEKQLPLEQISMKQIFLMASQLVGSHNFGIQKEKKNYVQKRDVQINMNADATFTLEAGLSYRCGQQRSLVLTGTYFFMNPTSDTFNDTGTISDETHKRKRRDESTMVDIESFPAVCLRGHKVREKTSSRRRTEPYYGPEIDLTSPETPSENPSKPNSDRKKHKHLETIILRLEPTRGVQSSSKLTLSPADLNQLDFYDGVMYMCGMG